MKKKLLWFLITILLIPLPLKAVVPITTRKYVNDSARLLTEEAKDYISKYSDFLYKNKKIDIYVITVKNLEGLSIEEYCNEVFESYKISEKGLLILASKEDRRMRVQAGEKLSEIMDDDFIENYIKQYFMPYLEREEWNDGIINGYSAFYKYICEKYNIDASSMEVTDQLDFITKNKTAFSLLIVFLCIFFANQISNFFLATQKNVAMSGGDIIKIGFLILCNIAVLTFAYVLEPIYIIFGLAYEGFILYSNLKKKEPSKKSTPKKKKKEPKKKKRRRKS
ncbi:MAG: TPM domain-containing protein [Bacilli bacterium]|nr:TPM domain-containing protein [Bacilli bacterium]